MKMLVAGCLLSLVSFYSVNALAEQVTLPLKDQVQTSEGKLCIYSDGQKMEKVIHDGGDDACPPQRVVER